MERGELSLCTLLSSLGSSIANVALPALTEAFAATFREVQWVVIAYLLVSTAVIASVGQFGDIVGRRRLLLVGLAGFGAASVLCALAPSLRLLIAARAAQGVAAAVMMALSLALVADAVPKARAGSAMGVLGTMSAIGTALGPALGGFLLGSLGWRSIFAMCAALAFVALMLARRGVTARHLVKEGSAAGVDILGTILLTTSLASYALAATTGHGRFGLLNVALCITALIGLALFALVESTAARPLIRLQMLRKQGFGTQLATAAIVATVMMTTLVVGPFYLARALGLDAASLGLVLSAGPLVAALAGIPAGRLTDRFGTRTMTLAGLLGVTLGSLALAVLAATSIGIAGYLAPIVVMTASYAVFQAANNTAVMRDSSAEQRGLVSGLLNLSRNLGLVTGASAMGALFALASGTGDAATASPGNVAAGMRTTFAVATVLVAAALAMAARRPGRVRAAACACDVD